VDIPKQHSLKILCIYDIFLELHQKPKSIFWKPGFCINSRFTLIFVVFPAAFEIYWDFFYFWPPKLLRKSFPTKKDAVEKIIALFYGPKTWWQAQKGIKNENTYIIVKSMLLCESKTCPFPQYLAILQDTW